jgi:hypothetical protein
MALSNGNGLSSGPLIFLNPRSKDKDDNKVPPHFEIARVGEDKKIKATGETATKVTGDLLRPRFTTREFKGVENKHFILYIKDGDETCNLDLTYRISSRSLMNAILSLTDPKGIEISIYESKKGYEALSLWQGDKMVPWKFDGRKGEIPEADVIKDKKGTIVKTDFSEVDEFFESNLKAWADKLFGAEKAKNDAPATNTESAPAEQPAAAPAPAKAAAKPVGKPAAKAPVKTAPKPTQPVAEEPPLDADVPF